MDDADRNARRKTKEAKIRSMPNPETTIEPKADEVQKDGGNPVTWTPPDTNN